MAAAGTNPKIEELRFKLKTDPKSRLFYPLAEELRKVGQFGEAEQVLRAGLATHTTYLSAWVVLGRVLREQQKYAEAVEALNKALELDRGNVVAARLLADCYLAVGDKVEAIKKYKLVHALLPRDEEISAVIARLETELQGRPAAPVPLAEPPAADEPAPSQQTSPAEPLPPPAGDEDVFDVTYTRLQREAATELETGDVEPMSAAHSESPFEEPAADAGYTADAFEVEQPSGIHLAAPPLAADIAEPFPPPPLPPETSPVPTPEPAEEAEVFEPASEIAPGFVQGTFDANVPPPPTAADDFAKTITMADLYANQGLIDEARDIYEDILARDPGNAAVRAKLEALVIPSREDGEESGREEVSAAPGPDSSRSPALGMTGSEEPRPDSDRRVKKLERWLTKVKRSGVGSV